MTEHHQRKPHDRATQRDQPDANNAKHSGTRRGHRTTAAGPESPRSLHTRHSRATAGDEGRSQRSNERGQGTSDRAKHTERTRTDESRTNDDDVNK